MESLREAPNATSFIPLAEHQSATPASFYSGPPVLHYYSDRCKVLVLDRELGISPDLAAFAEGSESKARTSDGAVNGESEQNSQEDTPTSQKEMLEVDVWVTSDKLLAYRPSRSIGLSIPYRSIALHAIQSLPQPSPLEQQGVYMQIISPQNSAMAEDEESESISITIIPTASAPPPAVTEDDPVEDQPEQTPVMAMFTALSNCSNLHPDPVDPNDEEAGIGGSRLYHAGMLMPGSEGGDLPPPMPGSGGWITAENMHEYVDEEGNWIGGEEEETAQDAETLGPGAGSTRTREAVEQADDEDGDSSKWQRTS